jgi:hypothetical protein
VASAGKARTTEGISTRLSIRPALAASVFSSTGSSKAISDLPRRKPSVSAAPPLKGKKFSGHISTHHVSHVTVHIDTKEPSPWKSEQDDNPWSAQPDEDEAGTEGDTEEPPLVVHAPHTTATTAAIMSPLAGPALATVSNVPFMRGRLYPSAVVSAVAASSAKKYAAQNNVEASAATATTDVPLSSSPLSIRSVPSTAASRKADTSSTREHSQSSSGARPSASPLAASTLAVPRASRGGRSATGKHIPLGRVAGMATPASQRSSHTAVQMHRSYDNDDDHSESEGVSGGSSVGQSVPTSRRPSALGTLPAAFAHLMVPSATAADSGEMMGHESVLSARAIDFNECTPPDSGLLAAQAKPLSAVSQPRATSDSITTTSAHAHSSLAHVQSTQRPSQRVPLPLRSALTFSAMRSGSRAAHVSADEADGVELVKLHRPKDGAALAGDSRTVAALISSPSVDVHSAPVEDGMSGFSPLVHRRSCSANSLPLAAAERVGFLPNITDSPAMAGTADKHARQFTFRTADREQNSSPPAAREGEGKGSIVPDTPTLHRHRQSINERGMPTATAASCAPPSISNWALDGGGLLIDDSRTGSGPAWRTRTPDPVLTLPDCLGAQATDVAATTANGPMPASSVPEKFAALSPNHRHTLCQQAAPIAAAALAQSRQSTNRSFDSMMHADELAEPTSAAVEEQAAAVAGSQAQQPALMPPPGGGFNPSSAPPTSRMRGGENSFISAARRVDPLSPAVSSPPLLDADSSSPPIPPFPSLPMRTVLGDAAAGRRKRIGGGSHAAEEAEAGMTRSASPSTEPAAAAVTSTGVSASQNRLRIPRAQSGSLLSDSRRTSVSPAPLSRTPQSRLRSLVSPLAAVSTSAPLPSDSLVPALTHMAQRRPSIDVAAGSSTTPVNWSGRSSPIPPVQFHGAATRMRSPSPPVHGMAGTVVPSALHASSRTAALRAHPAAAFAVKK